MATCTKFRVEKMLKLVIFHKSLRGGGPRSDKKEGQSSLLLIIL